MPKYPEINEALATINLKYSLPASRSDPGIPNKLPLKFVAKITNVKPKTP
ncbi:hypothetical protein J6P11_03520 [bacterium]|nr:hypothetical protein [bacterium]